MAKISTYANDSAISSADKVIGSNAENANATVNFTMSGITSFVYNQTIAQTTSTILAQVVSNPTLGTITNHVLGQVLSNPTLDSITTHVLGEVVDVPTIETISDYVYTDQIGNITTHVLGQIPEKVLQLDDILAANSYTVDQGPTQIGVPHTVKFSSTNILSNSNVQYYAANDTFVFSTAGIYYINAFGMLGKGNNSNVCQLDFSMILNDAPYGRPNAFWMKEANYRFPYEISFIVKTQNPFALKFEILRNDDDSFHNDGGLFATATKSYGTVPSAGITIKRLRLQ